MCLPALMSQRGVFGGDASRGEPQRGWQQFVTKWMVDGFQLVHICHSPHRCPVGATPLVATAAASPRPPMEGFHRVKILVASTQRCQTPYMSIGFGPTHPKPSSPAFGWARHRKSEHPRWQYWGGGAATWTSNAIIRVQLKSSGVLEIRSRLGLLGMIDFQAE